jgi:hypothetical protein
MALDYPNFFPMPTHVDWLYDIALPVSMSHTVTNISFLLCYISNVPFLRKTSLGPDKCQLVNYSAYLKFSINTIEHC